jgi:hypothetical protein
MSALPYFNPPHQTLDPSLFVSHQFSHLLSQDFEFMNINADSNGF